MTEANIRHTLGFLKSLVGQCANCMRRHDCDNCFVKTAKFILHSIEADANAAVFGSPDYTIAYRMAKIEDILRAAGRPLMSSQIDTRDICSKQLKYWTLNKLMRMRRISRFRSRKTGAWLYFIPKNKQRKNHT